MSLLPDPATISTGWHGTKRAAKPSSSRNKALSQAHARLKSISVPSLSSVVRGSITWAGSAWYSSGDIDSKDQKDPLSYLEDHKQVLYLRMRNAVSYEEWKDCACELDRLENNNTWKETFECSEYNPRLVQERLKQLEEARLSCDVGRMLFLVRTALSRELGKMGNASLYRHTHFGTKDLIDSYITTAVDTINALVEVSGQSQCDASESRYILDQLLAARQAFGRSALLFSGGATFGMNHIGVLKALWMAKLLPRIISGASAGSIVCAVFCTRTEDELPALLASFPYGDFSVFDEEDKEENILQKTARFLKHGAFLDIENLAKVMRHWLGDITFQEAYNRTRRILNICVSSAGIYELPRLLNYITAPNVLIWSAVAVSCSVPLVFSPYTLMAKDPLTGEAVPWNDLHRQYIDGSVDGDLPMNRLSEMFNVNHFIVSQVNPHVVPFLSKDDDPRSTSTQPSVSTRLFHAMTHLAKDEILHRMTVLSELGVFPTSITKTISIMNQKYSGDINIYPEILYTHFPRILKNPTTEFMLKACLSGERATWPKLGRIRNHCAIELALDSAIQKMRVQVALGHSNQIDLKANALLHHSSLDSSGGRGRRRRSSYSHQLERRRRASSKSSRTNIPLIKRSHSHSFEPLGRSNLDLTLADWSRSQHEIDVEEMDLASGSSDGEEMDGMLSEQLILAMGGLDTLPPSSKQSFFSPDPECTPGSSKLISSSESSSANQSRGSSNNRPSVQTPHLPSPNRRTLSTNSISPPRFLLRMTPATTAPAGGPDWPTRNIYN